MEICIVSNGNKFEAINYIPSLKPLNCILIVPNGSTWKNDYFLLDNEITVSWQDYYNYKGFRVLKVIYKGATLLEKHNVTNTQLVIDVLNKYSTISKNVLEVLLKQFQEKEKTSLEITIEELKAEKAKLEEQIKIYQEIQAKKDEIKELMAKLD